jgi:hypothetical protein
MPDQISIKRKYIKPIDEGNRNKVNKHGAAESDLLMS